MTNLLDIQHVSKRYGDFALRDMTLSVPAGSVVGFIGSNGAGKTTTIKAALGMIDIDNGSVNLFGTSTNSAKQAAAAKQRVGAVLDSLSFPDHISVGDVAIIMKISYANWDQALFDHFREQFNLDPKKKVKELSRGMGMKLSLACALSHHPDLLLLDEATAGLDPLARDDTLDILRAFMEDESHGILISSHITSDLEKIADYIICIDGGELVFSVEKDTITDLAGVAQCRDTEFEKLAKSNFFGPGEMRYVRHSYGISVLIPDRLAFTKRFGNIAIERATIDQYMGFMLKGELR